MEHKVLYHHGIKGQRWGVRRFQKKDGSLTSAGRKRYSDSDSEMLKAAKIERRKAAIKYTKASHTYSLTPTADNRNQYKKAEREYSTSKLNYKVAKYESKGGFDSSKKKSKHRLALEERYQKLGYDHKQAAVLANGRIRTERILVGTAAVTATAAVAYAIHKRGKDRTDQILKSGTVFQRIEATNTDGKLHDMFYASTGKHDNKRYEGMLAMNRKAQTGEAYVMKMLSTKDIKVASNDKAAKVFGDLYKNDADFRSSVAENVSQHFAGKNKVKNISDMSDKNIRKMYDNFNSGLGRIRDSGSGADKKFYNKLKDAGYDAIQDVNDLKYSGYRAKNPLIVFNNSNNAIGVKSVKELTDVKDILNKGTKEMGKSYAEGMGQLLLSPYASVAAGGTATAMYVSDRKNTNKR